MSTNSSSASTRHNKTVIINNKQKSIYTDNPENLSETALYRNRQKFGIYNSPSAPTVGVPSHSSGK